MKLTGVTNALSGLDAIGSVELTAGPNRIFGVLNAAKPAVISALQQRSGGQEHMLVVTPHGTAAAELADELRHWTSIPVVLFPAMEALPYERVHLDRTLLAARQTALRVAAGPDPVIVVAPVRALLQPVRRPEPEGERSVTLSVGDTLELQTLLGTWNALGYAPAETVEEPGRFARRGGVIDVFPGGREYPVRIELFGNEIESIRTFDPSTQRSICPIVSVTVHPLASLDDTVRTAALAELRAVDTSSMNAEAETGWLDDLSRLEAGASIDELVGLAPYLNSDPVSLADVFPARSTVVFDAAADSWSVMRELWEQARTVQGGMEESGNLPPGLKPALLEPAALTEALGSRTLIEFHAGSGSGQSDRDWSGVFAPARLYAGRLKALLADIGETPGRRTVISTFQHERLDELLREGDLPVRQQADLSTLPDPGVTLLPESVSEGWAVPQLDITILSEHELFGRPRSRPVPRRPGARRETLLAQFSPGDYVVHLEHGVGRFDAITRMAIDGSEREYAVIQYAGADRVYVPTDQLERLTRYIGVGDAAPHLNKLGGSEWQRARSRAKAAAAEIARELVDIYSKRMARPAHAFGPDTPWQHELESSFQYVDTPDQLRAVDDVKRDMETARPMDRLVCADVGYGKTEVAVRAAFKAIMDGRQVAVLVPTTILAQQHYETFIDRFAAFPVRTEVLSRLRTPAEQRETLRRLATGEVDVVIGTHRLLQKDVSFKNLGLLIIDEEQRFGVRHKEQLKRLREAIDVLTLTATPIPRTLHMGLVGIREISVIDTPPEGRLPIKTYLQPNEDRLLAEAVLRELDRDGQVYIVHNRVATIEAMAEKVRTLVPRARVLVAHGQMEGAQLERVMMSFAHHEADILICSTIIENGLDIPNVNTIVVTNAHRLGLTQLYQLRGRVGRSSSQAYAYLLYPRDVRLSYDASRRLEAVFEAQDLGAGMNIALKDLEIRGVGNLLGAEQSGHAAAIGFDLYTRLIGEAVEQLRGVVVDEPAAVSLDLPMPAYLPHDYVASESMRLTLYRRLAGLENAEDLDSVVAEIRDRFGSFPTPVANLIRSVRLKLLARAARVTAVLVGSDYLTVRGGPGAIYDRVSLHQKFGSEARISTTVLRVPRERLGGPWMDSVEEILKDMVRLRESVTGRHPATA